MLSSCSVQKRPIISLHKKKREKKVQSGCAINRVVGMLLPDPSALADSAAAMPMQHAQKA